MVLYFVWVWVWVWVRVRVRVRVRVWVWVWVWVWACGYVFVCRRVCTRDCVSTKAACVQGSEHTFV